MIALGGRGVHHQNIAPRLQRRSSYVDSITLNKLWASLLRCILLLFYIF